MDQYVSWDDPNKKRWFKEVLKKKEVKVDVNLSEEKQLNGQALDR